MPLCDVQWVLGHAHLSTTQLYLTPAPAEVIAEVLAHHQRRRAAAATPAAAAPVAGTGYRVESLDDLVPQALLVIVGHGARRRARGAGRRPARRAVSGADMQQLHRRYPPRAARAVVAGHPPGRRPAPGPDAGAAVHRASGQRVRRRRGLVSVIGWLADSPWPDVAGTLAGQRRRRFGQRRLVAAVAGPVAVRQHAARVVGVGDEQPAGQPEPAGLRRRDPPGPRLAADALRPPPPGGRHGPCPRSGRLRRPVRPCSACGASSR